MHGIINLIDMSLSKLWEMVKDRETWHAAAHWGHKIRQDLETEQNGELTNEISLEYSLEALMLKLKLQSVGHLM